MVGQLPIFHENWYATDQLRLLAGVYEPVRPLRGAVLEIGCWEGRSTVVLAAACYPEPLLAIDTWRGNLDENSEHVSVLVARERDVFAVFEHNVRLLTKGNVVPVRMDCHEFLASFPASIKFCHIDASHDYASVGRTVDALLPKLVAGGVLCGDDFATAHAGRMDLQGGVERAVRECLVGFIHIGNFWYWQKGIATSPARPT